MRALTEIIYLKLRRSQYVAARRAFLLERSQKDNNATDQFDKEMAKIQNEEDMSSPPWETTPLHTPNSKVRQGVSRQSLGVIIGSSLGTSEEHFFS